jgi:type VI secretion system protein ImpL
VKLLIILLIIAAILLLWWLWRNKADRLGRGFIDIALQIDLAHSPLSEAKL